MMNKLCYGVIAGLGITLFGGCANMSTSQRQTTQGAAIGTVAGGVAGAVLGHQTGHRDRGAIIGAVAGGVLGGVIGRRLGQQKEELEQVPGVEQVNYDQEQQKIEATLRILFDTDKSNIKSSEAMKLDQLASVFMNYPENIVMLEGHTDSDGSESYNQKLSERRASSIELYLRRKNLNIAGLSSVGYGETRPTASNETPQGKALNRRVELKISVDPNRVPQQQTPQQQGYPQQQQGYPQQQPQSYPQQMPPHRY